MSACSEPTAPATTAVTEGVPGIPQVEEACLKIEEHADLIAAKQRESGSHEQSTPEAPNATLLKGKVLCLQALKASALGLLPERVVYAVTVEVISAGHLGSQENLLAGREGENVVVLSDTPFGIDENSGETEVIVTFRGEAEAGSFWVIGSQFT